MLSPMKIRHEVRYDAPPDEVYAMLTDPEFREKASYAQDATSVEVTIDAASVRIELVQPNTDIPAFARAIAGESTRAIQTEQWSQSERWSRTLVAEGTAPPADHRAAFKVDSPGKPIAITGTRTLVPEGPDGSGTVDRFEGEAKATVPLIGGRIEKLVSAKLTEGWDKEHTAGVAWLKGER